MDEKADKIPSYVVSAIKVDLVENQSGKRRHFTHVLQLGVERTNNSNDLSGRIGNIAQSRYQLKVRTRTYVG